MDLQEDILDQIVPSNDLLQPGDLRAAYAETICVQPFNNKSRAEEIVEKPLDQPIFKEYNFHPEELPVKKDLLMLVSDLALDLSVLDHQAINATNEYAKLLANSIARLNSVKERLFTNQQRIRDINFICKAYSGLSDVIQIGPSNASGSYDYFNNTFSAFSEELREVDVSAENVSGNGYVGNAHVMQDADLGTFLSADDNRGNLYYATNGSASTVFEYSRICTTNPSNQGLDDVNYDTKDAVCTIELAASKKDAYFNCVRIETPNTTDLRVRDVLVSNDNGTTWQSAFTKEIQLMDDMYSTFDYAVGANIVSFPRARRVKLVLSSSYVDPDEVLGYETTDVSLGLPVKTVRVVKDIYRKVIAIQNIRAYYNTYEESTLLTGNLVPSTGKVNSVAVFANEYIPEHFLSGKDYITYQLIINGETYDVEPINSNSSATKLISCSQYGYTNQETNAIFLDEPIQTIQLSVTFRLPDNHNTAYLSNLKVCIG